MAKITVSRETFEQYSSDAKLDTLFDICISINDNQCEQVEKCEPRIKVLENRKFKDRGFAGMMGIIGGIIGGFIRKVV